MSYSISELSKKRKEIRDIKCLVNGKEQEMSFEQIERKGSQVEKKRSSLMKVAREFLTREQMVEYIENGQVNKELKKELKEKGITISKLPSFEVISN